MPGNVEYVHVEPEEPTTPPPYMDPGNAIAKKKSIAQKKKSLAAGMVPPDRCAHCGAHPQHQENPVYIWPAPRPVDHIRPDNTKFFGYVILIAVIIFLLFAACKYLP